ncbi:hypothetical protein QYF36_002654 [Acer negundo]|nr:hypothetical protein QYF36_002654 [Acer negundo]
MVSNDSILVNAGIQCISGVGDSNENFQVKNKADFQRRVPSSLVLRKSQTSAVQPANLGPNHHKKSSRPWFTDHTSAMLLANCSMVYFTGPTRKYRAAKLPRPDGISISLDIFLAPCKYNFSHVYKRALTQPTTLLAHSQIKESH